MGREPQAVLRETGVPRLSIAPSTLDLVGLELEIAARPDRAIASRKRSRHSPKSRPSYPRKKRFTYVLVDCPPSLNL